MAKQFQRIAFFFSHLQKLISTATIQMMLRKNNKFQHEKTRKIKSKINFKRTIVYLVFNIFSFSFLFTLALLKVLYSNYNSIVGKLERTKKSLEHNCKLNVKKKSSVSCLKTKKKKFEKHWKLNRVDFYIESWREGVWLGFA